MSVLGSIQLTGNFLGSSGSRAGFLLLAGMLLSFGFIRMSTRLMRSPKVPWWPGSVKTGGVHIHHLVFGIVLLMLAGFLDFAFQPDSPWLEILAVAFGIGAGLTLDEFALWLHLEDVYWAEEGRRSVDAIVVATIVAGAFVLGVAPIGEGDTGSVLSVLLAVIETLFFAALTAIKGKYWAALLADVHPLRRLGGGDQARQARLAVGAATLSRGEREARQGDPTRRAQQHALPPLAGPDRRAAHTCRVVGRDLSPTTVSPEPETRLRILYGVNGEGMGHATRSEVVIDSLLARHDVRVIASGTAFRFLTDRLPRVDEIFGPSFALEEGEIRRWATVRQNLRLARHELPETVRHWIDEVDDWQPDVVISDFEPLTGIYARLTRTPLIAVGNINMLDRCRHDREIIGSEREDYLLARTVAHSMVPGAVEYIVTTFFRPPVARGGTTLVPPIVRPEIVDAQPERGDHLVVYSSGDDALIEALRAAGIPLPRLWDARRARRGRHRRQPRVPSPLQRGLHRGASHRSGSRRGRRVLAAQRGRLPGQAGALDPLRGQFEQLMNARYLERLGYGLCATDPDAETSASSSRASRRSSRSALAGYGQSGNSVALERDRGSRPRGGAQPRPASCARRAARRGGPRDEPRRAPAIGAAASAPPGSRSSTASTRPRSSTANDLPRPGGRADDRADLRRRPESAPHRAADGRARAPRRRATFLLIGGWAEREPGLSASSSTRGTRSATTPGRIRRCRCAPRRRSARS